MDKDKKRVSFRQNEAEALCETLYCIVELRSLHPRSPDGSGDASRNLIVGVRISTPRVSPTAIFRAYCPVCLLSAHQHAVRINFAPEVNLFASGVVIKVKSTQNDTFFIVKEM